MFTPDKPIYLQIYDRICNEILAGKYSDDARIPSVRDYGALLQVNANTAVKAYEQLSREEIIYQRRGMGYFVTAGARDNIKRSRRQQFIDTKLKDLFQEMKLLEISMEDVVTEFNNQAV